MMNKYIQFRFTALACLVLILLITGKFKTRNLKEINIFTLWYCVCFVTTVFLTVYDESDNNSLHECAANCHVLGKI